MKQFILLLMFAFTSAVVFAQNGGNGGSLDVNITKNDGGGSFPWLWVIGGLVFVVLLVALLSGGRGGRDRIVEKKTIVKE
jgi:hypothetical protein